MSPATSDPPSASSLSRRLRPISSVGVSPRGSSPTSLSRAPQFVDERNEGAFAGAVADKSLAVLELEIVARDA